MTRKDYRIIAEALARAFTDRKLLEDDRRAIVNYIAKAFVEDNHGFNREKFDHAIKKAMEIWR